MTDPTEAIRKALDAGPTGAKESHQSIWLQVGKCVMLNSGMPVHARIAICEYEPNASYVAACNPAAIRSLLDRLDSAERDKAELLEKIGTAYGHLWNTNNEPMAPVPLRSIGEAAYEARKILRDTLTKEQRGDGIYRVQEALRAGEQKEPK